MIKHLQDKSNVFAALIIIFFFTISFLSFSGTQWFGGNIAPASLTVDESVHITSGYYSLKTNTMFLNPEHPPLAKDIAALPLLILNPSLPEEVQHEQEVDETNVLKEKIVDNDQYYYASKFLLHPENNIETIVIISRTSVLVVNTILLYVVFILVRKYLGKRIALISLFLIATTPTFIAHSGLTNTDTLSAFLTLITLLLWGSAFKSNLRVSKKQIAILVVSTSAACLSKFSVLLIIPVLFLFLLVKAKLYSKSRKQFIKEVRFFFGVFLIVGLVILIWYILHTFKMKPDDIASSINHQTEFTSKHYSNSLVDSVIGFAQNNVLTKALYTIVLGIVMVYWRLHQSIQSITFMGNLYVDQSAGVLYFPILFLSKSTIGFLFVLVSTSIASVRNLLVATRRKIDKIIFSSDETIFPMLLYFLIFSLTSLFAKLQIGVRHIAPVNLILCILLAIVINTFWSNNILKKLAISFFALILIELIIAFPKYINFYNIPISMVSENGAEIATDSNLDWGQSLYRLAYWLEDNNINEIYVSTLNSININAYTEVNTIYHGIELPDLPPAGSYYAVSITYYQIEKYRNILPERFDYLDENIVATIDNSIYIFKI